MLFSSAACGGNSDKFNINGKILSWGFLSGDFPVSEVLTRSRLEFVSSEKNITSPCQNQEFSGVTIETYRQSWSRRDFHDNRDSGSA
jgi:hypothetical protein